MFQFICPHCRAKLSAQPDHAGKPASCGKCQRTLTVPPSPAAVLVSPSETIPLASTKTLPWKLIIAAAACFLVVMALVCGGGGYLLFRGHASHSLYERAEIEGKLSGATPEQVRQKIGSPDEIVTKKYGYEAPGHAVWSYHHLTRISASADADHEMLIFFEDNHVYSFMYPKK